MPISPALSAPEPYPGMVVIHHAPGWDEWYRECTRRFAHHGYVTISPNLYFRDGHGTAEDVGAKVRAGGGVPDEQVLGDLDGANNSCVRCRMSAAKSAYSAPAPAGAMASSPPADSRASTRWWNAGAAASCRSRKNSRPSAPLRRSIIPRIFPAP